MANFVFVKRYKSSSSDKWHSIKLNTVTNELSCSCPGWIFKREGQKRSCKHLRRLAAEAHGRRVA